MAMTISIEQIDEMRKRTNCSYQEAKELLEKNNGDLIDAIIEFEKKYGSKTRQEASGKQDASGRQENAGQKGRIGAKIKELIQKGFRTRFIIEKDGETVINLSINIMILLILITMPAFFFYIAAFIILYILGYKVRIRQEKGKGLDVNEFIDGISGKVKNAADKMREKQDAKEQKVNSQNTAATKEEAKKDDGYNEITIG